MNNTATIICINYYPRVISNEFATFGILGVDYKNHRVAAKYVTGNEDQHIIDFFNLNTSADLFTYINHSINDIKHLDKDLDFLTQMLNHSKNSVIRYELHCVCKIDDKKIEDIVIEKYNELVLTRH